MKTRAVRKMSGFVYGNQPTRYETVQVSAVAMKTPSLASWTEVATLLGVGRILRMAPALAGARDG
jgi:hypothetical protein